MSSGLVLTSVERKSTTHSRSLEMVTQNSSSYLINYLLHHPISTQLKLNDLSRSTWHFLA